ncbi:hypothetical protein O59_002500 [Cellvibrio sp. BR]|uniref:hypothetical protein n=1 Tax=Cellvibrio sp. BR TaxID=1134474 RepID=UPI00026012F8|nr:hypothetical protein [Cellvibrio sp. BR]EIK44777.1 hypothetical protein O59_002500 [Cellvibrio sp. BR]
MNMMDKDAQQHFSDIEVQDKLAELTELEIARICQIYRQDGCEGRAGMSDSDVISEVITKVLACERRWPVGEQMVPFLVMTGRSIISNEEEKRSLMTYTDSMENIIDGDIEMPIAPLMKLSSAPAEQPIEEMESAKIISNWITKINEIFETDEDAMCYLKNHLDKVVKSKILTICNFTDQVYRNVEKRIKDKMRKRFPEGIKWWKITS